jgi:hypothetical protein
MKTVDHLDRIRKKIQARDEALKEARARRDDVLAVAATFTGNLRVFRSGCQRIVSARAVASRDGRSAPPCSGALNMTSFDLFSKFWKFGEAQARNRRNYQLFANSPSRCRWSSSHTYLPVLARVA